LDTEWQILAPLVPVGGSRPGVGGRPVTYPRRDIVDAIRYVARTDCQWDARPADFPPAALVKHYFTVWTRDGTLDRLHNTLREQIRQVEGRNLDPSAALVDSQTCGARKPSPVPAAATTLGRRPTAVSGTS
jgi:transposase